MARKKKPAGDPAWTDRAKALHARMVARMAPAPDLKLSEWAESNINLPEGQSARPGRYRNWPYFREVLDSIGDPEVERVSFMKPTRVGYTKGLMVAIGATAATEAAPIILLVPTDDDARDYAVDEIEPLFEASPALQGLVRPGRLEGRQTLKRKTFVGGGSLKILAARAPRNLRRHDAKKLFIDECDAMDLTVEGDPIALAERRTMAHPDRKIVIGSTPTDEDTSIIARHYAESDQRVFEVPCPQCGSRFELTWEHVKYNWEDGKPETAHAVCPVNGCVIEERNKLQMVEAGAWRPTRPDVGGHRGYRMNAAVSLLANASWGTLAREYLKAKRGGPAELQVFANTVEGRPWKTSLGNLTAEALASRVENFSLEDVPVWVLMITVGVDVQDDRLECTVLGWPLKLADAPSVLGHVVIPGNTLDAGTWAELDTFLKTTWRHPKGWTLRVDAAAIDSGGSKGRTQKVYDFCRPRMNRRIFAIRGVPGPKPIWQRAVKVKGGAPVFNIGHDQVKTAVMQRLAESLTDEETGALNPHCIRLSDDLTSDWFEQATGESRKVRYVRNRTVIEFIPKRPGQRVEALDCLCYGWAVRQSPAVKAINLAERAAREPDAPVKTRTTADWAAAFNA